MALTILELVRHQPLNNSHASSPCGQDLAPPLQAPRCPLGTPHRTPRRLRLHGLQPHLLATSQEGPFLIVLQLRRAGPGHHGRLEDPHLLRHRQLPCLRWHDDLQPRRFGRPHRRVVGDRRDAGTNQPAQRRHQPVHGERHHADGLRELRPVGHHTDVHAHRNGRLSARVHRLQHRQRQHARPLIQPRYRQFRLGRHREQQPCRQLRQRQPLR